MSDFTDDVLTDDLTEGEQVEDLDEAVSEEELPFLDIDQYKDYRVPVKVDGEEMLVPLTEAVAGFQRQADYTRKTQEVSKLKEEIGWGAVLKSALDTDPAGTIQLLASRYGVGLQTPAAQDDPWGADDDGWSDPADKRYRDIEARLAAYEQERNAEAMRNQIAFLQTKHGEDFDPQEVVTEAVRLGINDLERVYKMIAFDRVEEKARKAAAEAAALKARKAATTKAKQEASVVSGGSSTSRSGSNDVGPISSVREAYEAAIRQLSR